MALFPTGSCWVHLRLTSFALPLGSRLLSTATGLVTLNLKINHPSTYFQPNALLQWLSFMQQLETLVIILIPVRNRDLDVERQTTRMPITRLTLPNLRWFGFQGASVYVEAVVHLITTPRLEKLQISVFNQLTNKIVKNIVAFTVMVPRFSRYPLSPKQIPYR
jgi:hypothetical protein